MENKRYRMRRIDFYTFGFSHQSASSIALVITRYCHAVYVVFSRVLSTFSRRISLISQKQAVIKMTSLDLMSRYISPVNPAVFPHLSIVLLAIGIFFTAWFFVYEVTSTKFTRDIFKELIVSLVASVFMGFGIVFLLLWVGIYI